MTDIEKTAAVISDALKEMTPADAFKTLQLVAESIRFGVATRVVIHLEDGDCDSIGIDAAYMAGMAGISSVDYDDQRKLARAAAESDGFDLEVDW